jgi:tetratricopeptide (TPR) repeat protein
MRYRPRLKFFRKSIATVCTLTVIVSGGYIAWSALNKNAIFYNKEAWEHLKKENYRKAIFNFRNALVINPKYKEALIGLGKAYLEVDAYDQAYGLFTAALAIDKQSVESLVGLGKTLAAMGNYTGAIKYFNSAETLSAQNLEARYGRASVYNNLGKKIWAQRTLDSILKIDPYHYDSLLLMAEIKSSENRLKEARRYVEKAIDSRSETSKGFVIYGDILLRDYLFTENNDLLVEAKEALANAISIQPESYQANRLMGNISLMEKKYDNAVRYFKIALGDLENGALRYSLAIAYDRAGNKEAAMEEFRKALGKNPSDSIARNRFEDFLVFQDIKIGHPERVSLNQENYDLAVDRMKKNLPDQAIMYLRRSLMLNPMNIRTRELLMDYYSSQGFNGFYLDEMKEILRLNPDRSYQEKLSVAIMKRRDLLYHREGYSVETPPRDVPSIFVLNFDPLGSVGPHPDAGEVIASQITFVLGQFGRMKPVGLRARNSLACGLTCAGSNLDNTMAAIEAKTKTGELGQVDYILYGTYHESGGYISIECQLMDSSKGFIIGQFSIMESGKESLPLLSLRTAKRIYDMIPYKGRVLKMKDSGIITNIGLIDGLNSGEKLVIYKFGKNTGPGDKLRKRIIFTVKEADTLISYAEPQRIADLESIDSNDTVYPLKKRRAKKID